MKTSVATVLIVISFGAPGAAYAQNTPLRAGAAKVDVTPSASELPKTYDGILDHLYSRAIVLDNGNARAALITVDAGAVPDAVWKGVSEQVEKDLGIPARNVLLTATHTHSVPGQTGPDYVRKIADQSINLICLTYGGASNAPCVGRQWQSLPASAPPG